MLDICYNNINITTDIQVCKSLVRLKKLHYVSLGHNNFNKSIISCLSFLPSLTTLDLSHSYTLGSSFPMQELSSLRELKTLALIECGLQSFTLNGTMSNLQHLSLDYNKFFSIDDIMRSMAAAFPSLRFLSLQSSFNSLGGRLFAKGVPNLPYLEVLLLRYNGFNGTLPMEALAFFRSLEVLDLSYNSFVGSIPSTIKSLSSLKVISLANNVLNGSLTNNGLCELKSLYELDLSYNMFHGNLPECFNRLSSLKFFDISSNQFSGTLQPSLIANLKCLEYIDFSHNSFEGSFSFSSFSNHTKLEFFRFERDNAKFEVETEEPVGWIPVFQLKLLVLSNNWNTKSPKESGVPNFLLHQHNLRVLDLSHNSLDGELPNWLLKNNTNLEVLKLRNNSLGGVINVGDKNYNLKELDVSENHITGTIPKGIHKFIPSIEYLNFSGNALSGGISLSVSDLRLLRILDLSNNKFSGEVPRGLFTILSSLEVIKLSNNTLHGHVLSGNLSLGKIRTLQLDDNRFTGNIGNITVDLMMLSVFDISNNFFTSKIPSWMSNRPAGSYYSEFIVRNNDLEGEFPCGSTPLMFLDISHNLFSGPIPSCLNFHYMKHLHLGSNEFTGLVPDVFRNLSDVLTLDISNNKLSGRIPEFLGELSNLRILLLGKNNFIGSIPNQLCQLNNVSLIDLSSNSLTGRIPRCLKNITGPKELAFVRQTFFEYSSPSVEYLGAIPHGTGTKFSAGLQTRDEVQFTTKKNSLTYKGNILDYMSGLDLSCNKLTGEIPEELGMLAHILALNLSHNQLRGPIPVSLSNLAKIESLDLSSNSLSGKVPSELIKLTSLAVFDVSYNNLSGRLPLPKAQFATFTSESYEGNPLLCGLPLENKCTIGPQVKSRSSAKEDTEKWHDIDEASFYGSSVSTWLLFILVFASVLYINPYWRRRWLDFVEDCMYSCYHFRPL